ncbi:MAG: helix-turn-helix domain-containing protein [Nocardioides sp.]|uniref:helix-turn-helix domain-containing protein n=1 Tax=Nocardioides sp. TaxID=35761 RepID=UPI0023A4E3AA|nr:helix-turn-helix domain-containing protein [Nocardioides sp.]MDE0776286.1 helix-turn-helix domain-containing protein [Nocardioides sp.]
MPEEVLSVIDVIGNNVRTEILRRLAQGALTAGSLAEQIGVHVGSVHRHLVMLEQHELVTTDVDPGKRRGQMVLWRTNTSRLAEWAEVWERYASGRD